MKMIYDRINYVYVIDHVLDSIWCIMHDLWYDSLYIMYDNIWEMIKYVLYTVWEIVYDVW